MPSVVRIGDVNGAGGSVTGSSASTVFANGRKVSLPGDSVTPHTCCGAPGCAPHCGANTTGGSSTVFAEGQPIILVGDIDSCGHSRTSGSPSVFASK